MQDLPLDAFYRPIDIERSGISMHSFGEAGISYGRILKDDDYHILKGGATVKYVMGFSALSLYTPYFNMELKTADTMLTVDADMVPLYTHNVNPYVNSKPFGIPMSFMDRAGKSGLGLDLGLQYEYHPDGTPNYETPYKYSIAISLTDLGSVAYIADSGSGSYSLTGVNKDIRQLTKGGNEDLSQFLNRLTNDTVIKRNQQIETFRMGLPTALRINTDWVVQHNFNMAFNVLLNLKGNAGEIYRPAYVSYFNFTPSYGNRYYNVSLPTTFYGRQTLTMGVAARIGPFYIGSSSAISSLLAKKVRNVDAYFGFVMKIRENKRFI